MDGSVWGRAASHWDSPLWSLPANYVAMFFMTCETQQKLWQGLPRRSTKLIELNFQREYLCGYFQSMLFHTSGKMQTERASTRSSTAWWDLLLRSWLPSCQWGRCHFHCIWSHPWWKRCRAAGCCFGALPAGVFKSSCSGEREPQTDFYPAVQLYLCNNNVLSAQGEINTEPNLPWEYLSKFLNEYSLEFSCSYVLLGSSWL